MADYISRDYTVENMENYPWDTEHDKNAAIHLVRELVPAADVRPVVKCLECENALRDDSHKIVHCNQNGKPGYVWCKKEGCCRAEDFFCANGVSCSCGADMREVSNEK